jgi:hypothetical protein
MRNELGSHGKSPIIGSKGKEVSLPRDYWSDLEMSSDFDKEMTKSQIFFPVWDGVEIKNPPTKVGGKQ